MATYLPAKTNFNTAYNDTVFDMSFRKLINPPDNYTYSYPMFSNDTQKPYEAYRGFHEAAPGNQFTFNQSITHVNLVNNKLQMHLSNNSSYNNANNNSYQLPTDSINIMSQLSAVNPFQKNDSRYNFNDAVEGYPSPPMGSTVGSAYNQQPYPKTSPVIDFNTVHTQMQGSLIPRTKSDQYPSNFYSNYPSSGMHLPNNLPKLSIFSEASTTRAIKDQDVDQADDTQKCKNTIEGTKTSVRRFKRWYKERYNKDVDMNSVSRFNAPELLKDFFLDIRDTRPGRVGNEYEPVTLTTYRNGLRRYFLYRKVPPAPDNFDLTDKGFDIVNRHLVTKRDDLKRKGKGNHPNAIESITPSQLEKMWASGAIGTHAPRPLLRLMWWYNTVYHGVRGRMAHHELSVEDFLLKRGMDGKLFMEYVKNNYSNENTTASSEPPKKKKCKGLVKETDGGDRDAIRAFEIFKAHRPPGISSFYLTPKTKPKGDIWFNKVPMGKNSIGRVMREIKAISAI